MRSALLRCAATVAVLAVVACGGGEDDEAAIRAVFGNLQQAARQGEGERICTQIFTPKLADSVTKASKLGSCAKQQKASLPPNTAIKVEDVEVKDQANARAHIKEQNGKTSEVFLVKQGSQWRIRSVVPA